MNKKWTIIEENYIKENINLMTDEQIANKLTELTGRPVTKIAVCRKRQKMGLKKTQGRIKNQSVKPFYGNVIIRNR